MGRAVTIVLAVICVILLILCVILGILFAAVASYDGPKTCTTSYCLADAARIQGFLNTSVDPCDNFYDFACGNFPKDKQSQFGDIGQEVLETVRRLLEEPIQNDAVNSTERKMKEFYASCLESDVKEAEQMSSLKGLLKNIGGFNPNTPTDKLDLEEFNPSHFNFDRALQYVQFNLSTPAALTLEVELAPLGLVDSDILESYLTIKSRMFGLCDSFNDNGTLNSRYNESKAEANKIGQCFGDKSKDKTVFGDDVMDVIMFNCDKLGWPAEFFTFEKKRLTWKELLEDQPWLQNSKVDWFSLFEKPYREWNDQSIALEKSGLYMMKQLSDIYNHVPLRKFRNYLIFTFLSENLRGMPKCVKDVKEGNTFSSPDDTTASTRQWKSCITQQINPTFSLGVLSMLEKEMDHPIVEDKKLRTMVEEIRQAAIRRTKSLPWLKDFLKERIIKRVEEKVVMLGGPRRVLDDDYVDNFFKHLHINKSLPFLVNDMNAKKFQKYMQAVALRSPNIHYHLYIKSTNAMFVNAMNEVYLGGIVMFWSILKLPFYNYNSQEYLQYGGIGTVIGHEFGHDFDGIHTYKTWANATLVPELVTAESCLQDYYMNWTYPGWKPPPKEDALILSNQGIPDVVGLRWAMDAYRKHVADRGPEHEDDMLPGLPYTQEQLFLVARAQNWCNNVEFSKFMTIRVLAGDGLNPYFGDVFNCPKNSQMNPEDICNLW